MYVTLYSILRWRRQKCYIQNVHCSMILRYFCYKRTLWRHFYHPRSKIIMFHPYVPDIYLSGIYFICRLIVSLRKAHNFSACGIDLGYDSRKLRHFLLGLFTVARSSKKVVEYSVGLCLPCVNNSWHTASAVCAAQVHQNMTVGCSVCGQRAFILLSLAM